MRKHPANTTPVNAAVLLIGEETIAARVFTLLQQRGLHVVKGGAEDITRLAPAAVVEAVGGIAPAFAVTMDTLAAGIPCITANPLLLAAHGRALQAAAVGQHTQFRFSGALGVAAPLQQWLGQVGVSRVSMVYAGGANAVAGRMAARNESPLQAENALTLNGEPMVDVTGKHTFARGLSLHTACWGPVPAAAHRGLEAFETADFARMRQLNLRTVYGVTLTTAGVYAGLLAVPPESPLLREEDEDVLLAETPFGEHVFSRRSATEEETAHTICADVAAVLVGKNRAPAALPLLPQAGSSFYFVRAPYAAREEILKTGFSATHQHTEGEGVWTAVGTAAALPVMEDGLVMPVVGEWEIADSHLRLVS